MEKFTFKYDQTTTVTITSSSLANYDIEFFENGSFIPKLHFRFRSNCFKEAIFHYKQFEVRCTAIDGSAFIASYRDDVYYMMRKKKRKVGVLFLKNNSLLPKYNIEADGVVSALLIDNKIVYNRDIVLDFAEKRKHKPLTEEEFLKGLDEEEKKYFIELKKIESIIEIVREPLNLSSKEEDRLCDYILDLASKERNKIYTLNKLEIVDQVTPMVEYLRNNPVEEPVFEWHENNKSYELDDKYIFLNNDFDNLQLNLDKEYEYVDMLYFFFLDRYEDVKEYYEKSFQKVKDSIDEYFPYFEEFVNANK